MNRNMFTSLAIVIILFGMCIFGLSIVTMAQAEHSYPGYPVPDPEFDIGYPIYWYGYPAPGYPAPEIYEEIPGYPAPEIEEIVEEEIDEKIIENTMPGVENNAKNKSVVNQKLWKQEVNRIEIAIVEHLKKVGNKILFWLK